MEHLLKEFLDPILIIVGITYTGTVLIKFIPGPFDKRIFDDRIFGVDRHTIDRKNILGLVIAFFAIFAYFL